MENDWVAVEGNATARGFRYMSRGQRLELCTIAATVVMQLVWGHVVLSETKSIGPVFTLLIFVEKDHEKRE